MNAVEKHFSANSGASRQRFAIRGVLMLAAGLSVMGSISRGEIFGTSNELAQARIYAATNRAFDCVVAVGGLQTQGWWSFGSGVLIAPRWVLFAGHQADPANMGSYDGLRAYVKAPGTNTAASYWTMSAVFVHPDYTRSSGSGVDLALGYLTEAVTNITPAVRCRINPLLPTVMTMVGFGCPGVVGQPVPNYDGIKRGGFGEVKRDPSLPWVQNQYFLSQFKDPASNTVPELQWLISGYDSGCPWWVTGENGQLQVAGIASFIYPGGQIAQYGWGSGALNITLYNEWIDSVIASVEPKLTVQPLDSGTVQVQWPAVATNFSLQTSCVFSGTNWVPFEAQITTDGTNNSVTAPIDGPMRFFRLLAASPFPRPGVFLQKSPGQTVNSSRGTPSVQKSTSTGLGTFPETGPKARED